MIRYILVLVFVLSVYGCKVGDTEEGVLARARTPHGVEVTLLVASEYRVGELLSVSDAGILMEVGSPHHLLFVEWPNIEKIGFDDSAKAARATSREPGSRPPYSMRRVPTSAKKMDSLVVQSALLSRFPQGLSDELLQQLADELGVSIERIGAT